MISNRYKQITFYMYYIQQTLFKIWAKGTVKQNNFTKIRTNKNKTNKNSEILTLHFNYLWIFWGSIPKYCGKWRNVQQPKKYNEEGTLTSLGSADHQQYPHSCLARLHLCQCGQVQVTVRSPSFLHARWNTNKKKRARAVPTLARIAFAFPDCITMSASARLCKQVIPEATWESACFAIPFV